MSDAIAQKVADHFKDHKGVDQFLGIELLEIGAGYAKVRMTVTDDMTNIHDSLHGGMSYSLADSAFAYACNSRGFMTFASGCSMDYLAPAHVGDVLTAIARLRGKRGKQGIFDVDVTNQDDKLIATFRGKSHSLTENFLGE